MRRMTLKFLYPLVLAALIGSGCKPEPAPPKCDERTIEAWQPSTPGPGTEAQPVLDECGRHVGYRVTMDATDNTSRTWTLSLTSDVAGGPVQVRAMVEEVPHTFWFAQVREGLGGRIYDDSASLGPVLVAKGDVMAGEITREIRFVAAAGVKATAVIRDLSW